jgi:hypothetical protein
MNIDEQTAADAIMSAIKSDAFSREACVKICRQLEQSGFKRGLTFYERNQRAGEILVRYHEERK